MLLTAAVAALSILLALLGLDGEPLDTLGWTLLAGTIIPLVWRRRYPLTMLMVVVVVVGWYHTLDYSHAAAVSGSLVALYSMAAAGPRSRTIIGGGSTLLVLTLVMVVIDSHEAASLLMRGGWVLAALCCGEAVRIHRQYLAAVLERAERAERTREEEAARRVAEERLRIARDLHDLLAHSITMIGVRTSVASHLLIADPERLDRHTLAQSLDGIADTCRDARAELRSTLRVLRAGDPDMGPLPGVEGLPDLVRAAETGGARVTLTDDVARPLPAAHSAAVYRIVQESLTNAVRHAGPTVRVRVSLTRDDTRLRLTISDDGPPDGAGRPQETAGFGIPGMRERARSVDGTLSAGPRDHHRGFQVTAELPLPRPVDPAKEN